MMYLVCKRSVNLEFYLTGCCRYEILKWSGLELCVQSFLTDFQMTSVYNEHDVQNNLISDDN